MTKISEHVLHELAKHETCVLIDQLDQALPGHKRRDIINAVGGLIHRKLAKRDYAGCYLATDAGRKWSAEGRRITSGPNGPLTGKRRRSENSLGARLWSALRTEGKATTKDLVSLVRRQDDNNPEATAARYLGHWCRAGFVTKLKTRVPGTSPTSNGFVKWRIIRDNGPKSPYWQPNTGYVVDGNTGDQYNLDGVLIDQENAS